MSEKDYNYEVLIPLLMHFYPARFSGIYQLEKRLYNIETLLARMAQGAGIEGHRVEPPRPIEQDVLDATPAQIAMYIQGIAEIQKLSPFVKEKQSISLTVDVEETYTLAEALALAKELGLKTP